MNSPRTAHVQPIRRPVGPQPSRSTTAGTTTIRRAGRRRTVANIGRMYLTEMKLFARETQTLIFVFGFPILTVLVLSGVFGSNPDDSGFEFVNPQHYYASAYFGIVLAAIGLIMLPTHIASYRERGVIRRYDTAGFPRWVFPTVQYLCGVTVALLGFGAITLTAVLSTGMPAMLSPASTLIGLAMGTLAFISIGIALGLFYPSGRAAQGLGLVMFFPMFLLAGGGPPPAVLTDSMRSISNMLPLTHVMRASQEPWLAIGDGRDHLMIVTGIFVAATLAWLWKAGRVSRAS